MVLPTPVGGASIERVKVVLYHVGGLRVVVEVELRCGGHVIFPWPRKTDETNDK